MVNSHILFGTIWKDRNGKLYNSSYLIGKNGDVNGIYNKAHLVPFGNYPFGPLSAISSQKITAQGAGFASGDGHDPIITSMGKVGILICYEEEAFPIHYKHNGGKRRAISRKPDQ